MRIAYTMNGLVGGVSGKNSSGSPRDDQLLVLSYVSQILKKYIVPYNNVDFFIFSWHTDFKEEFIKRLSPKAIKLLPQIDFKIPEHLRGEHIGRVMAHKSRWYGFKEVMNLVSDYEKENNFEYDLVVNARLDTCWNRPFKFEELNPYKFHIPIHPDIPNYGWPTGGKHPTFNSTTVEMLDHVFASKSRWMKGYSSMFDFLDEYTLPGQCPQWKTISHHFLMIWHLRKLGLLSDNYVQKSFKTLHEANPKYIVDDFTNKNTDYDIFRFRQLTREQIVSSVNG